VNSLEGKQNTEKRELVFTFKKKDGDIVTLDVRYKAKKSKTKLDSIAKNAGTKQEILEYAIAEFKKQTQVDYFINKNAHMFLTEQLDLYLHQVMLTDKNVFNQSRLNQLKSVKVFAKKIIGFISQFEDELVKIWNKQKFVLNSNYVITLNRLPEKIIKKLAAHKGMKQQIAEWKELGIADKDFTFDKEMKKNNPLPIDTKYFKDLETEIISQFDNLDSALDGRLINSENYQALNTLKAKYSEKIDLIYIDPPFNTGNDFIYVDRYQDSTWLSLMNDRLLLAKDLLSDKGSFYLHLDENADFFGRILFSCLGFSEIKKITFDTNATKDEEADLFGYKSFGNNFALKSQTIYFGKNPEAYLINCGNPTGTTLI
jgi:adenine specific DNA methylase Mod